MDLNTAKTQLDEIERRLYAYRHAMSLIMTDAETVAPPESQEGRGVALGVLAGEEYKIKTDSATSAAVDFIYNHKTEADPALWRRAELLREETKKLRCIPIAEYTAYEELLSESGYAWLKAKRGNDFAAFAPYLEKILAQQKHFAALTDPDKDPYDVQLDDFEEGTDRAYYDRFFGEVKAVLVPLIAKVNAARQPDCAWLKASYPIEQQRRFSKIVMDAFKLDPDHCVIGETEHPFTNGTSSQDVRITTHYYEHDVAASLYSVIHEGGHANYELHVDPAYDYNCLGGGCSTALHESQSRFYENYVGRCRAFTDWLWPRFCELFPQQTAGRTAEDFYRGINAAKPSLIRTEADELTYSMHVVIRYEIEKQLFAGTLAVADLPAAWNRLYKEYLGVDVPDDTRGVLQDVHWSEGYFGYFPTYSLGTAYSAQILDTMKKELDFDAVVGAGDMQTILDWLTAKLYRFGRLQKPATVVPAICGAPFTAKYYTDYLTEKFSALYDL